MRSRRRSLDRLKERLVDRDDRDLSGYYEALAAQVVAQRNARGLSQQQLAGLCGTTQSSIARLESGGRPPRIDTLLRIANALDCELAIELRPRTIPRRKPA